MRERLLAAACVDPSLTSEDVFACIFDHASLRLFIWLYGSFRLSLCKLVSLLHHFGNLISSFNISREDKDDVGGSVVDHLDNVHPIPVEFVSVIKVEEQRLVRLVVGRCVAAFIFFQSRGLFGVGSKCVLCVVHLVVRICCVGHEF